MRNLLSKKVLLASVSLLIASTAFAAPNVAWTPYAAVPLDRTSTIILAILFVLLSAWFLNKTRKPMQQLLLVAVMVTGVYQYSSIAFPATIEMTGSDNQDLTCNQTYLIHNNTQEKLKVTGLSGAGCEFGNPWAAPKLRNGHANCNFSTGDTSYSQLMEADEYCYFSTRFDSI